MACFRYASIDLNSVYLPPSKLEFNYDSQDWLQKEAHEVDKLILVGIIGYSTHCLVFSVFTRLLILSSRYITRRKYCSVKCAAL